MTEPKHISEVRADLGYQPATASESAARSASASGAAWGANDPAPEDCVDLLFARFAGIWGELWVHRNGEEDDGTWLRVVRDLGPRRSMGGVDLIASRWDRDGPPTPGQFRKWAEDSVRPYDVAPRDRRLSRMEARPEVRDEHLARMRRMVGKEGP